MHIGQEEHYMINMHNSKVSKLRFQDQNTLHHKSLSIFKNLNTLNININYEYQDPLIAAPPDDNLNEVA
jgi:hypothetical protein